MNTFRLARTLRLAVAAGTFAAIGSTAQAQSLAAVTNNVNWNFAAAGLLPVPGTRTPFFFNNTNQRFIVIFSSECSVNAPAGNVSAWTDVDIVVLNGAGAVVATLPPTVGSGDAFCAANGSAGFDGWETNSVTAVGGAGLPAGNYQVEARARLNNGATGGWFGERALVVLR